MWSLACLDPCALSDKACVLLVGKALLLLNLLLIIAEGGGG